ncbi:PKD domain-containing protein [Owenweeksia hongkongensis]|nr:PKD domain-containing protein [Owenweeksia hongkongensis]
MIRLMQWPSTKQLVLLWLLLLGIFSSYARQSFPFGEDVFLLQTVDRSTAQADSCTADFSANSLNNAFRLVLFTNLSSTTFGVPNGKVEYTWFFGDGIFSYDRDPRHSYLTNGSYNVCLAQEVKDSVTGQVFCADTICKTVVVNYQPPPCNAEFIVDTANSYSGDIIVWNSSIPNSKDTLYSVYYDWDFGDGGTSTLAYPSHTYSSAGEYQVCLKVSSYDSINNLCSETYCDTFGADSLGNLIYKKSGAAFTINVLDPYSISVEEIELSSFEIYPNPTSDYVNISTEEEDGQRIDWEILCVNGKVMLSGNRHIFHNETIQINTAFLNEGMYVLKLNVNGTTPVSYYKLRVDR